MKEKMTQSKLVLKKGSIIVGKWNGHKYKVDKLLGEGANGTVYLVSSDWNWYALKIGLDAVDIQSEINALKMLAVNQQGKDSYLKDIDDYVHTNGQTVAFYTMRYVKGVHITEYIQKYGAEWFSLLGLNILRHLGKLHSRGWIFGDIKVENIMVTEYGHIELIDFGGATQVGKGVKQFTELYDRGYWNSGTRSADPGYDLFSFAVLCVQLFAPRKLSQITKEVIPQNRTPEELLAVAKQVPELQHYLSWLMKAWEGRFTDANEAAEAWRVIAHKRKTTIRQSKTPTWLKILVVASCISVIAAGYFYIRDFSLF